jgi:hypothetical protein
MQRDEMELLAARVATARGDADEGRCRGGVDKEREGFGFAKSALARFPKQPSYREAKRPQAAEEAAH